MRDLVNSLEEANDRYMEDNRMLTSKLLERTSLLKHMEEKIELLTQQNKNLVEKNIEVTKLGDIQKEKVETFKNKDKKKECRINELELELECEGKKLKTLSEKFNKSKNEILQLNKGKFESFFLNPQAPVAQKIADEVVFRRFKGEGVEFFLIGPH